MSELFSIYEDSLNIQLRNISKILGIIKNLSKEKTENALDEINNNINEANRIIKQMEDEILKKSDKEVSIYKTKIKNYKYELETKKNELESFEEKYINQKSKEAIKILENFENKNTETNTQNDKNLLENDITDELINNDTDIYEQKKKQVEMRNISNENNIGNSRSNFKEEVEDDEIINFKFEKNYFQKFKDLIKICISKIKKKKLKSFSLFLLIIIFLIIIVIIFIKK
jgi:vesicle transport through interaction with t-SNAREs protein 1